MDGIWLLVVLVKTAVGLQPGSQAHGM